MFHLSTFLSIAKLNLAILDEYRLRREDVTCFTSDTAANQKLAVKRMNVPWLACSCHVFELSSKVVLKVPEINEVRVQPAVLFIYTGR